jgi:hypothetical protein
MGALVLLVPLGPVDTIQRMLYETVANKQARGKKVRYAFNHRRIERQALMTGADNTERFLRLGPGATPQKNDPGCARQGVEVERFVRKPGSP